MKMFMMAALLGGAMMMGNGDARAQKVNEREKMTNDILACVNKYRATKGLAPMSIDQTACKGAEVHSRDMATHKCGFGHDGFDERMADITSRLTPAYGWAENVAYGSLSAQEVVDMWLHSPGHKKNIEGDYNVCGIGVAESDNGQLYFTHIFINKGGNTK